MRRRWPEGYHNCPNISIAIYDCKTNLISCDNTYKASLSKEIRFHIAKKVLSRVTISTQNLLKSSNFALIWILKSGLARSISNIYYFQVKTLTAINLIRLRELIITQYDSIESFAYAADLGHKTVYRILKGECKPRQCSIAKMRQALALEELEFVAIFYATVDNNLAKEANNYETLCSL